MNYISFCFYLKEDVGPNKLNSVVAKTISIKNQNRGNWKAADLESIPPQSV